MKTKTLFPSLGLASGEGWVLPALYAVLTVMSAGCATAQTSTVLHNFTSSRSSDPTSAHSGLTG